MNVEHICAEYFRSVSPLAQRIAEDIDSIRLAYKDLWKDLDTKDKNQVVDEALIDPVAVIKYANENKENEDDFHPLSNFSWFTHSQLNLFNHLSSAEMGRRVKKAYDVRSEVLSPSQKKVMLKDEALLKSPQERNTSKGRVTARTNLPAGLSITMPTDKMEGREQASTVVKGTLLAKPRNPPPPPPQGARSEMRALLDQDDIPKTGFDFLDNW